jgi:hypothetical protein
MRRVGSFIEHRPGPPPASPRRVKCAAELGGRIRKTRLLFCPTSQAPGAKIFFFPKGRSYDLTKPSRAHHRGRIAIVTTRGAGCDGRERAARRAARARTVKPCGPVPSTLGSSLRAIRKRRWLKSPTHRGERGAAVKPSRRECRDVSATCGDYARVLFCLHARLRVRKTPGIPCALFSSGATRLHNPGGFPPRERCLTPLLLSCSARRTLPFRTPTNGHAR